jgi:hypothetical protein
MKQHPHAEVLRAIADGVPLSEFEFTFGLEWREMLNLDWFWEPHQYSIRRKPQHIIVNGFKVPKPLDVLPVDGVIYTPQLQAEEYADSDYSSSSWACRSFSRGIAHATYVAATAHAKAMLGIDPEYFK